MMEILYLGTAAVSLVRPNMVGYAEVELGIDGERRHA